MALPITQSITINVTTTEIVTRPLTDLKTIPGATVGPVADLLSGITQGSRFGTVEAYQTSQGQASGTVTFSGGAGTESAVINGVTVSVTWATSDANTAALLAAAINASTNALVFPFVTATSAANVTTIKSKYAGPVGNAITFTASGTGTTASGTGRLTGGGTAVTSPATSNSITY